MANLNKVMLIGNITRDPEVKFTPKGTAVCDISLAVNRNYTTDSGEKREDTTFVDIVLWGRTAEVVKQYCRKGSPLFVEGRLQLDTWDDKQTGQKRSKMRVVGEAIQLLGSRGSGGGGESPSDEEAPPQPVSRPAPRAQESAPPEDDDIPF